MSNTQILDLLDDQDSVPITPPNTVVDTFSEPEHDGELVMSPFLLQGRVPSRRELRKINQVITFSAAESSSAPSICSSPRFSSDDNENNKLLVQVDFLKKEVRQCKYQLVCLDITNRELEDENTKIQEDLNDSNYKNKRLKREVQHLREILNDNNEKSNMTVYVTIFGIASTTCAIILKYWKYLDNF